MSNTPTDQQAGVAGNVLHVRPHAGRSACADDMAARLDSTGLSIESCHDVYRALAQACTDQKAGAADSDKPLRAMVLCMDVLGAAELEFFTVVARVRPRLPIYIYGETAVGARLTRAVESGAVSEATDDLIDQLADVARAKPTIETQTESIKSDTQVVEPGSPAIDSALDDRLNLVAATPTAGDAPEEVDDPADSPDDSIDMDEPDAPTAADEPSNGDEERPVQVPWLNRPDRPVRGRPVDRTPTRRAPEPDVLKKQDAPLRGTHEPLLTNEELQALLGDDLMDSHGSGSSSPFGDGDRS